MGILDRKQNTFDDPVTVTLPPAPPAPPSAVPTTDAAVVAAAVEELAHRAAGIVTRLNERLAPLSLPKSVQPASDGQPARKLSAPYFDGLYVDLHQVVSHLNEIDAIMDRLAI